MRSESWIYTWVIFLLTSGIAYAHGVFHQITKKEAIVITAEHDDGEPMSYADVKVYSPGGEKIEHQNGRTDKNGRFAVVPDIPGEWKITIDGGMGHVINSTFAVDEALDVASKEKAGTACPKWHGIVTGLGVIFGLCGCFYYIRMRKLICIG
jgi:nickel transport protein